MKSTPADKAFLHSLFMRYYAGRPAEPVRFEAGIRCGARGKLGERKPCAGLCRECRASEFQKIQAQPLSDKERCAILKPEEEEKENG